MRGRFRTEVRKRELRGKMAKKRRIKLGKMALVAFITVLIWVWADRAQDQPMPVQKPVITIAKSTSVDIWASFSDPNDPNVPVSRLTLAEMVVSGPASRIDEVKRQIETGSLVPEFFLVPETEAMTTPGRHQLNVLSFLKKSEKLKRYSLTVESCKPGRVFVNLVRLVEKKLAIVCIDAERNRVKARSIEPAQVSMLVPESWQDSDLVAEVRLTSGEIVEARKAPVEKTPRVELGPGQTREASTTVKIMTLPEEDSLRDYPITTVTLGFIFSQNLQGKYSVELLNPDEVKGAIKIRATSEARDAYANMTRYQVTLEIDDEDAKTEKPRRNLVYNLPQYYVRQGQIELNQPPVEARFRLIPLSPEKTP